MKAYITFRNADYWISAEPEVGAVEVEIDDCLYSAISGAQCAYLQMQEVLSKLFVEQWTNDKIFSKDVTIPRPVIRSGPIRW